MVHSQQNQPIRLLKKLLLSLLLVCSSALIYADDPTEQIIGPFGTLNNRDTSATIADSQSQDLLNVDLTPGGKSFKKRKGYGQSFATAITSSPIHGTYDFFDSNGNDIALAFNDVYLTASISGASPVSLFTNGPFGVTYQCIDSQGFAYCADTARDRILKTEGVTVSNLAVISTGTMIAVTPDRLVQAGFAGASNRIDFSASADFTSWSTGVTAVSAFQFIITAPGSGIKHITYAFNRVMWFKDSSFGYILPGATAADWVVKTISPIIGTLDNSSVYYQDVLYFRAQDGNFYSYDGSSLQKISKEIAGTISGIQKRVSNSWTQTTQSDWAQGNSTPFIDTNTVAGNVQLLYPDNFTSYRNGTNGSINAWTNYSFSFSSGCGSTVTISSNGLGLLAQGPINGNACDNVLKSISPSINAKAGATFYIQISSFPSDPIVDFSNLHVVISSISSISGNPRTYNDYIYANFTSTSSGTVYLEDYGDSIDGSISALPRVPVTTPVTISLWLSTSTLLISINNKQKYVPGLTYSPGNMYVYLDWRHVDGSTLTINDYNVVPETATFYSQVKNAPNLTAWDSFSADYQNMGGSNSFFIRSSTNLITANSSTPAWSPISNGAIPSISTGTYFQIRDDFSLYVASVSSPILQDFTQNWFEGNASDKAYATYFNDRIWWSVAVATGTSSYNNRVLIYDLLNPGWLVYDIPTNGFFLKNLNLYFGSSLSGNIYKYGTSDNDNGSAINAYWKSKDFIGESPFQNDELRNISVYGFAVTNSTVTVTYTINEGTSFSYLVPTYRNGGLFFDSNRNLPAGTVTNSFNVKIGNNAADQPFEIIAERVGLNTKPWNPTSQ